MKKKRKYFLYHQNIVFLEKLEEERFYLEIERMCAKLRYDGKGKTLEDFEEERNENTEKDKEIREITENLEEETRKLYDYKTNEKTK